MQKENKQMENHTRNAYTRGVNAGILFTLAVVAFGFGITLLTNYIIKL